MRGARGCGGDDLGGPIPVQVGQGDIDPAGVGGLEGPDLVDLRPGVAVEQADEGRRTCRGPDGEQVGGGGQALLEVDQGGAAGDGRASGGCRCPGE